MKLLAEIVENLRAPTCQHQAFSYQYQEKKSHDVGTYYKIHKMDTALGNHAHKAAESGFGPRRKKFFGPLSKGGPAKSFYTKSERQNLNCRATWVWSARVNLYNRQIHAFFLRSWDRVSLMYSFKYNQQDATLYNTLYYCQCSTRFGLFLRPSSGAQELYTQHRVYVKFACCYR